MNELIKKIKNNIRITQDEALKLYDMDLLELGSLANDIRVSKFGKQTFYNINRHINPTNYCKDTCKFCAFSKHRAKTSYTMTHEQVLEAVKTAHNENITEVHIVSGHNNKVGLDWYMDMFKIIKEKYPNIHIKAMTAAEVNFIAKEYDMNYKEVLEMMIKNGVDSMPGGGAEIFDEEVRREICRGKVSSDEYIEIHKTWHEMGRHSTCTMLFGHVENRAHRIDHMNRLRDLQDITGGFKAFIPLVYQTKNNYLNIKDPLNAIEILKTYAIARIFLDNFSHIKAYWVTTTINLSLIAQEFGANDLDGTIQKETINSSAGAASANGLELEKFKALITNSGFIPVQRDSLNRVVA
ncbi:MAG: Gene SCO4494, often clustered with other genes in menaquinone via futalosine pathway [uncultured Campylobacterales bacterium]|uniref:Gene SCO4494, often clustered with other genes in menaquinone via futalosine pathway n=1 Tax=uncultured Campylobacterales bacterium TaxID=352960 RepID=A0A6S6STV8_9BACT|nr:MAG: Gene SCO4494, often clustered with other genes in menaquinone via futalosine pathway [uncultured Campylobacterales bacterium]